MWSNSSLKEKPAEEAVLNAISSVVAAHLHRSAREDVDGDAAPILIQVDGPGRTLFLEKLATQLDPQARPSAGNGTATAAAATPDIAGSDGGTPPEAWTAIRFDAWQYQRVAPPWWWLMSALDKQLRARYWQLGRTAWALHRWRDIRERLRYLGKDLLLVVPGAVIFVIGWRVSDQTIWPFVKWAVTAAGAIAALAAVFSSTSNALRRHLLAESPRGTTALLRSTDPMEDLLRRYAFLMRSAEGPVIVLIDNLDRCHAEYVVEMLEGIQTLLRQPRAAVRWSLRGPPTPAPCPLIAFVVAADRRWLCDSYLHVYKEFAASVHEAGRPFGLVFVDKVFDVALRIPTVPAAAAQAAERDDASPIDDPFGSCLTEHGVRTTLREAERTHESSEGSPNDVTQPVPELRTDAVGRLAQIELEGNSRERRHCHDTARDLDELLAALDPGPIVQRQLDTAYCVKRTTQLLAGHEVDCDDDAIRRLALWTILDIGWPLLAEHLSRHPQHLRNLQDGSTPEDIESDLALVFTHPKARRVADGFGDLRLTSADITKFTAPLRMPEPSR
jgi:hypothetical protein